MNNLAHRIILAWGWRRLALAFGAGALGALAMPPFGILPALMVSLTLAVWLLDGSAADVGRMSRATLGHAALAGWFFGFGYFVAGLWWLGSAFLVEADQFAWLMPLGVVGLPAVLAVYTALAFVLARIIWTPGPMRIVSLALALTATEWLRSVLFTGFPWNEFGMALGGHLWLAQAASWMGLHGLTLLATLICAAPATIATGASGRERWAAPAAALAALVLLAGFGGLRLATGATAMAPNVSLRIVQPNVPQDDKFRPENRDAIMSRYLSLSDRATSPDHPGMAKVTHLIWPESAFPFILARDPTALAQIAQMLPKGAVLVTGAVRSAEPLPGERGRRYFNAVQVVADDGTIVDSSDKAHLVPFGEYLPFNDALTALGLRQFVNAPGGFEAGVRRKMLAVPGLPPVAPLICYEAIFPGEAKPEQGDPGVLLNLTNDAWFGLTPGPYQHFAQARLRAIEEGLPLIRAANDGISAVVDPYGRIIGALPLGVDGVLDSRLPARLAGTPFSSYGNLLALLMFSFSSILLTIRLQRN
ncbi:apolipoprotein N-acyltransferase [Alsobacter metallidurans]|uniref:Apolipoprotein N-acyltransferase n=1 Tax=Alsobacter metallidurans TaxID=340221 RepID=A0A917IBZ4_9HYPH|nr:apolipoprotein N-acyltransferase [Alsobacter metallidurans]GGH34050.1 apolipoprotein N-acyltransferase [Alsobacter metallidurans]